MFRIRKKEEYKKEKSQGQKGERRINRLRSLSLLGGGGGIHL